MWGRAPFLVFTLDIIFLLYVAYKCCVNLGIGEEKRESQVQIMMTILFDILQRFFSLMDLATVSLPWCFLLSALLPILVDSSIPDSWNLSCIMRYKIEFGLYMHKMWCLINKSLGHTHQGQGSIRLSDGWEPYDYKDLDCYGLGASLELSMASPLCGT